MMKIVARILPFLAIAGIATQALAGYTDAVHVVDVIVLPTGVVSATMDGPSFTGCIGGNTITMDTTYMTQANINEMKSAFLAAQLSKRLVEIITSGCTTSQGGSQGKITSLKIHGA